jgi:hypothetical protein
MAPLLALGSKGERGRSREPCPTALPRTLMRSAYLRSAYLLRLLLLADGLDRSFTRVDFQPAKEGGTILQRQPQRLQITDQLGVRVKLAPLLNRDVAVHGSL